MTAPDLVSAGTVDSNDVSTEPTFGAETTEGNLLLAWACSNNPATTYPGIVNSDESWTLIGHAGAVNGYNWGAMWYKENCDADETAPTFSDDGHEVVAGLLEYSGVATSSALDQVGFASDADPCIADGVDTAGGDLIVALSFWNGASDNPVVGVLIYCSDGLAHTTYLDQYSPFTALAGAFYAVGHSVGPAELGENANQAHATISAYENSVSTIVASFKAA